MEKDETFKNLKNLISKRFWKSEVLFANNFLQKCFFKSSLQISVSFGCAFLLLALKFFHNAKMLVSFKQKLELFVAITKEKKVSAKFKTYISNKQLK